MQDEKTSLILGTIADVKKTIYDPCPYGYHMPPQDVWTNFTTITTAYNTGNVTEYNVVAADKYNQTNESTGFTDGKFEVWGRRFFTTGDAEAAGAGNVAFYPAAGYRNGYDGHVGYVGWGCYAWSASPYSATSQDGGLPVHALELGAPGGQHHPFGCVPCALCPRTYRPELCLYETPESFLGCIFSSSSFHSPDPGGRMRM